MKATLKSTDSLPDISDLLPFSFVYTRARVAIYDMPTSAPRVIELDPAPTDEYIGLLAERVYELARGAGGAIPFHIVREIAENLIHAHFAEPVVSIFDNGNTIRFTDQGPGIADKMRSIHPGFTTATAEMKRYIKGVGSGLSAVSDYLSSQGGHLMIEDNLDGGTVVTLSCVVPPKKEKVLARRASKKAPSSSDRLFLEGQEHTRSSGLSVRQTRVLDFVMQAGSSGPSMVARALDIALSTAYRDLSRLEELGLLEAEQGGKRSLSQQGRAYIDSFVSKTSF